jgi:hypothetical protein
MRGMKQGCGSGRLPRPVSAFTDLLRPWAVVDGNDAAERATRPARVPPQLKQRTLAGERQAA